MLTDVDTLEVDKLGSRKDVGGVALDILRAGSLPAFRLFTRRGPPIACGTGVALGERRLEPFLGDPFALRPPGTMVVTPLMLLESDAEEYERGLTSPVDDEPAAVERDVTREYRVGVSDGAVLRGEGMEESTSSVCSSWAAISRTRLHSTGRVYFGY